MFFSAVFRRFLYFVNRNLHYSTGILTSFFFVLDQLGHNLDMTNPAMIVIERETLLLRP